MGRLFKSDFEKKGKIFIFIFKFKLKFGVFRSFWCADVKKNILKNKKNNFNVFLNEKHFKKQPQPHSQTGTKFLFISWQISI